jgi:hypothetical protein
MGLMLTMTTPIMIKMKVHLTISKAQLFALLMGCLTLIMTYKLIRTMLNDFLSEMEGTSSFNNNLKKRLKLKKKKKKPRRMLKTPRI